MNNEYLLYRGALKVFDNFSFTDCKDFIIKHDTENDNYNVLRNKYHIKEVAGNGNSFSKSINLMHWVNSNVLHNNGTRDVEFLQKNSLSILDYTFGKGVEFGVYCRLQAIVFTECCLSIGLIARTIHCLPFSPYDFESHVVSMVYIKDLSKWVLFDAGNNAYFMDKNNIPLSPLEARKLLNVDECLVNNNVQKEPSYYKQYMAKNLFYIKFSAYNTFGTDMVENQKTYHLIPLGFNVKEREIEYCEYAIKNVPEHLKGGWAEALEEYKKQNIYMVSEEQFYSC